MSPQDVALCQQAIELANSGQTQAAYKQFCMLYSHGNSEDVTLLYWIAATTPSLKEAQRAMYTIARIEPTHPELSALRAYLARQERHRRAIQQSYNMASFPRPNSREQLNYTPSLRDTLIAATFSSRRAIDPNIKKIELGILKPEADNLRWLTMHDPLKRERGKVIYVTAKRTLGIDKTIYVGTENEVISKIFINRHAKEVRGETITLQNEFLGTIMHTHPNESPPSPTDLKRLILDEEELLAEAALYVITPSITLVAFRSNRTPEMSPEQVTREVFAFDEMIKTNPFITYAKILRFMQEKYFLEFFSCSNNETTLVKHSA